MVDFFVFRGGRQVSWFLSLEKAKLQVKWIPMQETSGGEVAIRYKGEGEEGRKNYRLLLMIIM